MGKAGYFVNGFAVLMIVVFNTFFCFPYGLPTSVATMNYNCVILVGVVALASFWWLAVAMRRYEGPKITLEGMGTMRRTMSKV